MKKKILDIISIVLISVIIISSTLLFALGADGIPQPMELTKISYQYNSETADSTKNNSFYYSDYMLLKDANVFSADIAKASVATSVAAYNIDYINSILSQMHYEPVLNTYNYNDNLCLSINDNDHVAYSVGKKEVNFNGETYIMYCVPVKGTSENAEWYSNFNLGTGANHKGFYKAANEVLNNLYGIFNNDGYAKKPDHRIIWLSGHSRGAAVANIIGGILSESGEYAPTSNIFAYSYACPTVSKNANTNLTNIYYFNNPGDLISVLPLDKWGYNSFGQPMEADMSNWNNVCYQFKRITKTDFASLSSSDIYVDTIYSLIGSTDTYNKPIVQLAMNLAGYYLGGKKNTTIPELIEDCSVNFLQGSIKEQLSTVSGMLDFLIGNYDIVAENNKGMNYAFQAVSETQNMTEKEFEQWANSHSSELEIVSNYVGYTVKTYAQLYQSYLDMYSIADEIVTLGTVVPKLVMLFIDTSGNPMEAITHGHEQLTYVTWINSMYYGNIGWYASNETVSVNVGINNSYIGDSCFRSSSICELTLGNDVVYISPYAFYGCNQLKKINCSNSLKRICELAFANCTGMTEINLSNGLETIDRFAFSGCTGVTEIKLPNSVITIGNGAFEKTLPTKVILPFVGTSREATGEKAYFSYVFDNFKTSSIPSTLKEVVITDTKRIGSRAFDSCEYIEKITILEGISTIEDYTFQRCSGLKEVNLPKSLNSIGRGAFDLCTSLVDIVIPDGVTEICAYAFDSCWSLANITLSKNLKTIYNEAFANCWGITNLNFLPDGIETIGEHAFRGCIGIETIEVPNSVTTIGQEAFPTYELKKVTLPFVGKSREATEQEAYFGFVFPNSSNELSNELKEVIITDATQIGSNAFENWGYIEKITINEGITTIGNCAFINCYDLQEINLPKSLTSIGWSAFANCSSLKSDIVIPKKITEIKASTFKDCLELSNITFSSNLTKIDKYAFYRCRNIINVYFLGTYEQWKAVSIDGDNESLLDATIHLSDGTHFNQYGDWNVVIVPTCTQPGLKTRSCECENDECVEIPALGHDYSNEFTFDYKATCTEDGYESQHCTRCESTINGRYVFAYGHNFYIIEISSPNCLQEGMFAQCCYNCNYYDIITVSATGHKFSDWIVSYEVTCTDNGQEYRQCENCYNEYEYREIHATGHDFSDWYIHYEATCVDNGQEYRKCKKCNKYEYREISATGNHIITEWIVDKEPTCDTNGWEYRHCEYCGNEREHRIIPPTGEHSFSNWIINWEPNCTENGQEYRECIICNDEFEYREIPATVHTLDSVEPKTPTCTESGYKAYEYCLNCAYTTYEEVSATGHNYDLIIKNATCTDEGYTTFTCSTCSDTYTSDYVDALGHTDGDIIEENFVAPTCTETGSKENVTYCTVCDAEIGRKEIIIDALGHTEEEIPAVAPTCTEIGLTSGVKCSVCDEILTAQQELPANGHKYESVVTAPTCTDKGYTTYTCICGESYVGDYTDPLGHDFENGTCTECNATDPEYFTFEIQNPSRTTIRCNDGIKLHTSITGNLPEGSRIEWSKNNSNFNVSVSDSGNEITIISKNNGYTTFTATVYDAENKVIAEDTIEMYSKSGFFDKIGGFFRSLFGGTKIYEN